jgi:hypothetical protein
MLQQDGPQPSPDVRVDSLKLVYDLLRADSEVSDPTAEIDIETLDATC